VDCPATRAAVSAERELLAELAADCHSPVGAFAMMRDGLLILTAELLSEDGALCVRDEIAIEGVDSAALLARRLLDAAPPELRALFGR
jgi:hydroxymethylbilane synthase